MAKTTNKALRAVDDEYRAALKEHAASKRRLAAASEARTSAHRMEELARSKQAQALAGLSDEEWAKLRQKIQGPEPIDVGIQMHEPTG